MANNKNLSVTGCNISKTLDTPTLKNQFYLFKNKNLILPNLIKLMT